MFSGKIGLIVRPFLILALVIIFLATFINQGNAQQIDPEMYKDLKYRYIGPQGNRLCAVVGVAGDPSIYYVGAASGGIFKTTDGGVNWKPIFDKQQVASIGSLAVAASDPNIVWAGTGEAFIRGNISIGNGIYKSLDGGKTWTHMGLEKSGRIGRVIIHPTNPEIVFAAALGHCYGPQEERGVFRTTDGGENWERVLFVDPNTGCSDINMDPNNSRILFAGMWQIEIKSWTMESGGPGSGLYVSRDGGTTWTHLNKNGLPKTQVGKIAPFVAPSNSDRVYALIETGDGVPWNGKETTPGELWGSSDGGESWSVLTYNRNVSGRCPYYTRLVVAPDDEDEIYFLAARMSMSIDGGKTLKRVRVIGGDNHDMWIDPTNSNRMIVGNDQYASISENRGKTWLGAGLPIAQMYHVYTDNQIPYNVYGNRQDGPSARGPSNSRLGRGGIPSSLWHSCGGFESGFAVPDPVDNNIVWSGGYGGDLDRYDERTRRGRKVNVWPESAWGVYPVDLKYRFQWTFPIVISPHDHNRVYVGSQHVHQTTDGGHSWEIISPDLSTNDKSKQQSSGGLSPSNAGIHMYCCIFAIAESPLEEGLIWAGTNDGLLHVTRNGGTDWTNVTDNIPKLPPWGTFSNIEPSKYDAGTCYVTVDFHQMNNRNPYIYKTTDFGKSWKSISSDIPRSVFSYAHCVREDPVRKGMLYLGTENSLFVSFNDGENWLPLQTNLPHAPVHWLTIQDHFKDLVVSTYGRGFWIMDDITPLQQLAPEVLKSDVFLFDLRQAYRFCNISAPMGQPMDPSAGENPPYGASINYFLKDVPKSGIKINILDEQKQIVRTLNGTKKRGINRIWWDLRYESSKQVKLRTTPLYALYIQLGSNGWRYAPVGRVSILAAPGTYSVKLTAGEQEFFSELIVKKDPNTSGTVEDIQAQVELLLELRENASTVADMINQLEWLRKQTNDIKTLLTAEKNIEPILGECKKFTDKLIAIEGNLIQLKVTGQGQDSARWPDKLISKIPSLAYNVSSSDFSPTTQQIQVHELYKTQIDEYQNQLNELLDIDLIEFNNTLEENNLPKIKAVK